LQSEYGSDCGRDFAAEVDLVDGLPGNGGMTSKDSSTSEVPITTAQERTSWKPKTRIWTDLRQSKKLAQKRRRGKLVRLCVCVYEHFPCSLSSHKKIKKSRPPPTPTIQTKYPPSAISGQPQPAPPSLKVQSRKNRGNIKRLSTRNRVHICPRDKWTRIG